MGRRDETFILYYWEDYEQYTVENPSCIYCLSESTVQIILSSLRFAGWRTRWRLNREDNNRRLEDDSIWNQIDALAALAQKEIVDDMTCELETAAQIIADAMAANNTAPALEHMAQAIQAIANKPCCSDGGNIGENGGVVDQWTDGDGINHPIYGSQPPPTVEEGTPPPGFDTWEEYQLNKCQVANLVFDGWLSTMRNLAGFTIFNAVALATLIGLALAGIILMPVAAIPIMIGLLITLGSFVAMFNSIASELESHRADIVCSLYRSDTVDVMTSILADALDAAIALLEVAPGIGVALKEVALLLVNADTLSQIMSGVAGLTYPDADCSGCEDCPDFGLIPADGPRAAQEIVDSGPHFLELTGGGYNDRDRFDIGAAIHSTGFGSGVCGHLVTLTSFSLTSGALTNHSSGAGNPLVGVYGEGLTVIYEGTTFPSLPIENVRAFEIVTGTESTVRLEWDEQP